MYLFIFFVNKPITIIPYLLGIFGIIALSFFDREIIGTLLLTPFCFTAWYTLFLYRYYVLRKGEEDKIMGVEIQEFRKPVNVVLFFNGLLMMIVAIFIGKSRSNGMPVVVSISMLSFIPYFILQKIIEVQFISNCFVNNLNLKEIRFNEIYKEVRALVIQKIIS